MTDEHKLLRAALVGRLTANPGKATWDTLGAAGVHGLLIDEDLGGSGLSPAHAVPVLEALGDLCLASPFLETSVVAAALLTASDHAEARELLREIAQDGARIAVAGLDPRLGAAACTVGADGRWRLDGTSRVVVDADAAGPMLVMAAHGDTETIFLVHADPAMRQRSFPTIDGRTAADLVFDGTAATLLIDDAGALVEQVRDTAQACLAIEAAALMSRLVHDTAAFARQREQFGQPISRFQVVQHKIVDMHIQARRSGAIARRAIAALDGPDRARAVSAAKVAIAQAGRFVGQHAVQLHGGMGMTEELPIGTIFKRLTVLEGELGSVDDALRRYATTR